MGLNYSKPRHKVTQVAPMPAYEEPPGSTAVCGCRHLLQQSSTGSFATAIERNRALENHLPPLRETWYGRYPTASQPVPFDLRPEARAATSIIKQHPPRRPQKLEPPVRPTDVSLDKFLSTRDGGSRGTHNAKVGAPKELENRGQSVINHAGRRQYLHKMKVLEMRKKAELERLLRQEVRLGDNLAPKDFSTPEMFRGVHGEDSSDDEEPITTEHNQMFNRNYDNPWTRAPFQAPGLFPAHPGRGSNVETWLLKQPAKRESFWDSSSTDSDNWNGYKEGKPALVRRTKTERNSLFEEFFDGEF